jgi:hypothetical protein
MESAVGFERQMEMGELEAGVADALCPDCDRDLPVIGALRRGEWRGLDLPDEIEISVPEGFAYYALDPELYRRAAACFVRAELPARVAVIGLRAIGTTLSTIVARELCAAGCEVASWTVRPRGDPWNRELRVDEGLAQQWREWPGLFAVIDEGPGLSGSSFASVSVCLERLGVPPERLVLFPSWLADASVLISETARMRWALHRKYCVDVEDLNLFAGAKDVGAGKWRGPNDAVAVQPQHERRKYLDGARLYKFAGYGRYGRAALERAEVLRGWIPCCTGLSRGFLSMEWVAGQPPGASAGFLDHAARYLAYIRREFSTGEPVAFEPLAEMISSNAPGAPDPSRWRTAVLDGRVVALDGRMLPHEWIETADGYRKADALDHHDDHFFPGPQDTAWDVAALMVEFGLDAQAQRYFLECYERASGDRGICARLPFYRLAYLACRFAYCDLAMRALAGTEDGARFGRDRTAYQELLSGMIF